MATIEQDMLNPRHLAELTGMQLNTVYIWRKRRDKNGMPEPDMIVARTPLWKPATIIPWLKVTNRLRSDAPHA